MNLLQYFSAIILNKNFKKLNNKAIKTDIVLVIMTIIIPAFILKLDIKMNISIVPLFIILYIFFIYLNTNVQKLYLDINSPVNENKKIIKIRKVTLTYLNTVLKTKKIKRNNFFDWEKNNKTFRRKKQ